MGFLVDDPMPSRWFRAADPNWNKHWLREGVEYISKTQAMDEFKLTKEEFTNRVIMKAYREKLRLRTKRLQNSRYGNSFDVYSVEDLKQILSLSQPVT